MQAIFFSFSITQWELGMGGEYELNFSLDIRVCLCLLDFQPYRF